MKILNDFNTSVEKALSEIDPKWRDYNGLIVCGTHSPHDTEKIIEELKHARENNIPTLGICFGLQMMAVEYARNVLNQKTATSQELGKGLWAVVKLPKMRSGIFPVICKGVASWESHWHQYAFNIKMLPSFKDDWDICFSQEDVAEIMNYKLNKYYMGVQFHPEYQSSKDKPHLLLINFLQNAKETMEV